MTDTAHVTRDDEVFAEELWLACCHLDQNKPDDVASAYHKLFGGFAARHRHEAELRGIKLGLEAAAKWASKYADKPLVGAVGWSDDEKDWHETGCIDGAAAIAAAICALDPAAVQRGE